LTDMIPLAGAKLVNLKDPCWTQSTGWTWPWQLFLLSRSLQTL